MNQTINQLAQELSQQLLQREWKLAAAESCTGGGLAYYLTEIAGSSAWFERGYVTYSNAAKQTLLGVRVDTLMRFGAVSQQTAYEMAEGALAQSEAQVGVAITGIAGPGGGSPEKPVGTVWFGWAGIHADTVTLMQRFSGDRHEIRQQAIEFALRQLVQFVK